MFYYIRFLWNYTYLCKHIITFYRLSFIKDVTDKDITTAVGESFTDSIKGGLPNTSVGI